MSKAIEKDVKVIGYAIEAKQREIDALRAQVSELLAALEPFKDASEVWPVTKANDTERFAYINVHGTQTDIGSIRDLRRAAEAYQKVSLSKL